MAEDKRFNRIGLIITFLVVAASSRLLPHPPNFTPIAAIALFGAAKLNNKYLAFIAPLAIMLLSDLMIGLTMGMEIGFHSGMWVVYFTIIAITLLGFSLRSKISAGRVLGASLTSSVIFFLVTNFAAWYGNGLYPHTFAGILESYAAGLAFANNGVMGNFFLNSVMGDLFYSTVLFGGFYLVQKQLPQPAKQRI